MFPAHPNPTIIALRLSQSCASLLRNVSLTPNRPENYDTPRR